MICAEIITQEFPVDTVLASLLTVQEQLRGWQYKMERGNLAEIMEEVFLAEERRANPQS